MAITQAPGSFGTVALGQAQARALPDLVAGRHTERTKMRKQRTQHMRLAGREQAQRRFVLAVIVRRNQIDGMGVVELVDLILSVDHRHIPTEQVDEEAFRSEEHTSELQSLMRISYAVFCL